MNLFDTLLVSHAIQMFGWALLHSLWQGIILAIFLKGALSLLRKASANLRYLLACLTLLLMLLLPISAALWSNLGKQNVDFGKTAFQNDKEVVPPGIILETNLSETESSYSLWINQAERQFLPWLVFIWLVGVFISSLRLLGVWTCTQQMKKDGKRVVLDQWRETLEKHCRQLRISKSVILFESSLVKIPTVIGWLKPVILIPSCALTGLTAQQFELILAHELAHIRRHDYLVNLFQTVIETFLFYHPAVWWVSSQIRNERENACDDLVVVVSGDAVVYARTLVAMERLRKANPSLAMAANGGSLTDRIHRLIGVEATNSKPLAGFWILILISIFLVTFGVTKQSPSVSKETGSEELLPELSYSANPKLNKGIIEDTNPSIVEEIQKPQNPAEEKPENLKEQAESEAEADQTDNFPESVGYQQENKPEAQDKSEDFIDEMASVGYTNLSVSQLVRLREADVTAEYVRSLSAVGFSHLSVEELWRLGINEITPAYIQTIKNAGYQQLTPKEFALLAEHDITPADINKLNAAGHKNLSVWQIIRLADSSLTDKQVTRSRERKGIEEPDEPGKPPSPSPFLELPPPPGSGEGKSGLI